MLEQTAETNYTVFIQKISEELVSKLAESLHLKLTKSLDSKLVTFEKRVDKKLVKIKRK